MNIQGIFFGLQIPRGAPPRTDMNNEQEIMARVRKLDPQVIGAIYDQHFPEVYRYVRYRVNDDVLAEDIASDVFMRLLEAVQKQQGPQSNLKGWLFATASNTVNDYLRRQYRRPTEELPEWLPDDNLSVLAEVDLREQNREVRAAYAELTTEQQHVLALRFGLGLSLEETALHMKKNVNAIKALQFRALASLQRQIGEATYE
jgi:RNA polymerase sigma-70 factor (ECF subfamily)